MGEKNFFTPSTQSMSFPTLWKIKNTWKKQRWVSTFKNFVRIYFLALERGSRPCYNSLENMSFYATITFLTMSDTIWL